MRDFLEYNYIFHRSVDKLTLSPFIWLIIYVLLFSGGYSLVMAGGTTNKLIGAFLMLLPVLSRICAMISSHFHKRMEDRVKRAELQEKYDELNDRYLRLYAEFDNYRKRIEKDKFEWQGNIMSNVITLILPVLDDLERGRKYDESLELIYNKFSSILSSMCVEEIKTIGEDFNVDYHDALTNLPVEDERKGKIIDEIQKGYMIKNKVIRHSKVVVGI